MGLEEMHAEKPGEFSISVHFPSTTAKTGWFSDLLEFASVNEKGRLFPQCQTAGNYRKITAERTPQGIWGG